MNFLLQIVSVIHNGYGAQAAKEDVTEPLRNEV